MEATRLRAALAATLLCAALGAQAHRFHVGMTDIGLNPATGSTEIVHTYMTHDVEALLANLYQRQFDLAEPDDEAVLRAYVEQRFALEGADGRRLPLQWVGVRVDTERVMIYQELAHVAPTELRRIHDEVLTDFLPGQVNTVNIRRGAASSTLTFGREQRSADLP
ncbi:DUF6702 family protein [Massilia glaciei]|uniref:Uncharacterized protein n=1 Tax=Massilia glaciei TaxID=1524097 RepID=A0A2U2I6S7_9BURK|nr:DUF6702 family protein [Massilia glaciei]PWF55478.1 hypothetical protein C7C56_001655 [Massilia glaciei]